MATPSSVAKRSARQTTAILAAVEALTAEVSELKAKAPYETGEIMAANGQAFAEAAERSRRILEAVAMMAAELITLKAEIAELKTLVQPAPAAPPRKARK